MTTNLMTFSFPNKSYAHSRMLRIHLTAAIPLLATRTLSMTCLPPKRATNSTGVATCRKIEKVLETSQSSFCL